ncbi:MAG TPA: TIM barrel protein [Thermoanaerobaculia bacterium]|nr:TIM barrel protein [Thermoanaerobaculia bacterium]
MTSSRRDLVKGALLASAALVARPGSAGAAQPAPAGGRFKLLYAPHFGIFRHHAGDDLVDQLRFMHDEGFRALEDNGMAQRPVADQERIAAELAKLGMTMGVFVAHTAWGQVSLASNDAEVRAKILADMRAAVEVAGRVGARWCTVVPGDSDKRVPWEYQTAAVIDNLRRCAEILEPAGLIAVLEPLNHWRDHAGVFLTGIPQAYEICRAVDSPAVKILDDLYHQQITEGNLIPNLDRAWDEIAYVQVGDNPGRKEPTTGEINYRNIFRHLHAKGYRGVVGMEHGNSRPGKEGERAVIEAYAWCDDFS